MTTSVAKNIIIKQPVIAGLTRNPFNNQGMLKQVQHDAYGIPSATDVVLFLELGKNKVLSQCTRILLGDALSLSKRMHRSVENNQSPHPHSVRRCFELVEKNAPFVRLCEKTFVRLRGKTFVRPLRPQLCAFALRFFYHKGTQRLHKEKNPYNYWCFLYFFTISLHSIFMRNLSPQSNLSTLQEKINNFFNIFKFIIK